MSKSLKLGVVGTSNKENEFRLPIHPGHIPQIDSELRKNIFLETGYGNKFGSIADGLESEVAGMMSREKLFETCDIILLPKPTDEDFPLFKQGQILWGWPHCVQGEAITQVAIDKKMTLLAWEQMFFWQTDNVRDLHIFHKNNEMAGYCSVLHALQLRGITGHYGPQKKAAVISFGATGRGSIHALMGMGYTDITVFTQRPSYGLNAPIPSLKYRQFKRVEPGSSRAVSIDENGETKPFADELANYDVIVNCILQNTDAPIMYIQGDEVNNLKPGTLIVDVSCDLAMGFDFARPTSFESPSFPAGNGVIYYAVDHTPTYLWDSATYEISLALLPYLPTVMGGKEAWDKNEIIRKCIEVENGVIQNPKILSFHNRSPEYPHKKLAATN
jgi:alanine dehydrogenase